MLGGPRRPGVRELQAQLDDLGGGGDGALHLGFGHIVASEIEVPIMLGNMV
jgi:hypothetical protein